MQGQLQVKNDRFLIDYHEKIEKNLLFLGRSGYFGEIKKMKDFFYKVRVLTGIALKNSLFMF